MLDKSRPWNDTLLVILDKSRPWNDTLLVILDKEWALGVGRAKRALI